MVTAYASSRISSIRGFGLLPGDKKIGKNLWRGVDKLPNMGNTAG
jgi:hypothetical protein